MKNHIKKIISFLIFITLSNLFGQTSQIDKKIRLNLWADIDAYPEMQILPEENDGENSFEYSINHIKKIVPFFMSGLVYGWKFTYIPYDKSRNVKEYFELEEIKHFDPNKEKINYTSAKVIDETFYVWCEFVRNDYQRDYYNSWKSIKNPVIHSTGYGKISDGFEGYTNAVKDAVKNGVREYFRKIIKNKPKEISGRVLIKKEPISGVQSGQYVINLDFFMECDKIVQYTTY